MTYYTMPDLQQTILAVNGIATSGRIALDNSAVTLPIGAKENNRFVNKSLFEIAPGMAVENERYIFKILETQIAYVQELKTLADEGRIFTIEDIIKYEMKQLMDKSGRSSHLFSFTKRFNDCMLQFERDINELLRTLRNKVPDIKRPYFFERISKAVNAIKGFKTDEPSYVDRKLVATAIYESCANRKRVNIITNDDHFPRLIEPYIARSPKELQGDVHCFMFDRGDKYALSEVKLI